MNDNARSTMLCLLIFCAGISGCKERREAQTTAQIQRVQAGSAAGETLGWKLSSAKWSGETQSMRDRAYRFCMERHADDAICMNQQDWSLIASNHAEFIAADYAIKPHAENRFSVAIFSQPSRWLEIRSECFAIYEDAGARDARMLGPCLVGALGGDYFSVVGVP